MVDDLRRVASLLRKPDVNRGGVASYYLGFCSTQFDPDTLEIAYDADGKIPSVDIVTH